MEEVLIKQIMNPSTNQEWEDQTKKEPNNQLACHKTEHRTAFSISCSFFYRFIRTMNFFQKKIYE